MGKTGILDDTKRSTNLRAVLHQRAVPGAVCCRALECRGQQWPLSCCLLLWLSIVLLLSIVEGPSPLAHLIARGAPTLSDGLLPTSSSVAPGFVPLAEGWWSTWWCGSEPAWRMPGCCATLGEADRAVQMPHQGFAEHTVAFKSTLGLGGVILCRQRCWCA
jgi:hypothetical protein